MFLRLILSVVPAAIALFGTIVRLTKDLLPTSQFVSVTGCINPLAAPLKLSTGGVTPLASGCGL